MVAGHGAECIGAGEGASADMPEEVGSFRVRWRVSISNCRAINSVTAFGPPASVTS